MFSELTEKASKAATEYCQNTRIEIPAIEKVDDESVVYSLRFMAFAGGYKAGYEAAQKDANAQNYGTPEEQRARAEAEKPFNMKCEPCNNWYLGRPGGVCPVCGSTLRAELKLVDAKEGGKK